MIIEFLDLAFDLFGDLAQVDILLRYGWPRAHAWLRRIGAHTITLGFAATVKSEAELDALAHAAADEELEQLLSGTRRA